MRYVYEVEEEDATGRAHFRCSCGKRSTSIAAIDAEKMLTLMGTKAFTHEHRGRTK